MDDAAALPGSGVTQRMDQSDYLDGVWSFVNQVAGKHEDCPAGDPGYLLRASVTAFDDSCGVEQPHQAIIIAVDISYSKDIFVGIDLYDGRVLAPIAPDCVLSRGSLSERNLGPYPQRQHWAGAIRPHKILTTIRSPGPRPWHRRAPDGL